MTRIFLTLLPQRQDFLIQITMQNGSCSINDLRLSFHIHLANEKVSRRYIIHSYDLAIIEVDSWDKAVKPAGDRSGSKQFRLISNSQLPLAHDS
jgi:hypothetical protein